MTKLFYLFYLVEAKFNIIQVSNFHNPKLETIKSNKALAKSLNHLNWIYLSRILHCVFPLCLFVIASFCKPFELLAAIPKIQGKHPNKQHFIAPDVFRRKLDFYSVVYCFTVFFWFFLGNVAYDIFHKCYEKRVSLIDEGPE